MAKTLESAAIIGVGSAAAAPGLVLTGGVATMATPFGVGAGAPDAGTIVVAGQGCRTMTHPPPNSNTTRASRPARRYHCRE